MILVGDHCQLGPVIIPGRRCEKFSEIRVRTAIRAPTIYCNVRRLPTHSRKGVIGYPSQSGAIPLNRALSPTVGRSFRDVQESSQRRSSAGVSFVLRSAAALFQSVNLLTRLHPQGKGGPQAILCGQRLKT